MYARSASLEWRSFLRRVGWRLACPSETSTSSLSRRAEAHIKLTLPQRLKWHLGFYSPEAQEKVVLLNTRSPNTRICQSLLLFGRLSLGASAASAGAGPTRSGGKRARVSFKDTMLSQPGAQRKSSICSRQGWVNPARLGVQRRSHSILLTFLSCLLNCTFPKAIKLLGNTALILTRGNTSDGLTKSVF